MNVRSRMQSLLEAIGKKPTPLGSKMKQAISTRRMKREWTPPAFDPHEDETKYIPADSTYNKKGFKMGSWRKDPMKLPHGQYIDQLIHVPVSHLQPAEETYREKWPYILKYAKRSQKRSTPPPISVLQTDKGGLKTVEGHRRVLVAKALGHKTIPAWVNWATKVPSSVRGDMDIETGMTRELAAKGHKPLPIPDPTLASKPYPEAQKGINWVKERLQAVRDKSKYKGKVRPDML